MAAAGVIPAGLDFARGFDFRFVNKGVGLHPGGKKLTPLLALRDLRLIYKQGGDAVLDGFDLDIFAGETLCVLGPSGCGKSTLLRLIAGLENPDGGERVWAQGAAPKIGFVFQEPNLMPWADVWANVYLPLRLAGVSRRDADPLVMDALEHVGLRGRRAPCRANFPAA